MPPTRNGSQATLAYFDHIAGTWSARYRSRDLGGQTLRHRRTRALEQLEGRSGRLLDIGCGSGAMATGVAARGLQFYGIDASPRMIDSGRPVFEAAGGLTACVALAEALPFPDASFDVAVCLGVIGAVGDREDAIAEARRVLRRGGTLLISFSNLVSPYAFWKGYVVYPLHRILRRLASRVTRRPAEPHRGRGVALYTPASSARFLRCHGMSVKRITYYDFNLFLSPLDRVFASTAQTLADRLARLENTCLRSLGTGFIATAVVDD